MGKRFSLLENSIFQFNRISYAGLFAYYSDHPDQVQRVFSQAHHEPPLANKIIIYPLIPQVKQIFFRPGFSDS